MKKWIKLSIFFLLLAGCSNMIDSFSNKDDSNSKFDDLIIQGDPYRGSALSATYSSNIAVTLQWCQYDPATTTTTTVAGENSATYTVRTADLEKEVFLQISDGSSTYDSNSIAIVDRLPFAENVTIDGIPSASNLLTGTYNYSDPEGDPEGTSTYRWLVSDTLNGAYTAIPVETDLEYNITIADAGKFVKLEVTPVSNNATGNPVISSAVEINSLNALSFDTITINGFSINSTHGIKGIDIDGDQDKDIVVSSYANDGLYVLENTGSYNFTPHALNNNRSYYTFKVLDIDHDNDLDIVGMEGQSTIGSDLFIYENNGNNNYNKVNLNYPYVDFLYFDIADINNDNIYEYIIAGKSPAPNLFLFSPGDNSVIQYEKDDISISDKNHNISSVSYGKLNGDTKPDIVSASYENNTLFWNESTATDTYIEHKISCNMNGPTDIFAIDMNNDTYDDILVSSFLDDSIYLFLNDGSNNFTQQTVSNNCVGASSVSAKDVNYDGSIDIIATSQNDDSVFFLLNDGSMNFTKYLISNDTDGPVSQYVDDIDGDMDYDIVVASQNDNSISLFINIENTYYEKITITSNASGANSVAIADLNGDGDKDIIASSKNDNSIRWFENDGSENFTEHVITSSFDQPYNLILSDIDYDTDIDFTVSSKSRQKAAYFLNDGSGNFTGNIITNSKEGSGIIIPVDVDNDFQMDYITSNYGNNNLFINRIYSGSSTNTIIFNGGFEFRSVYLNDINLDGTFEIFAGTMNSTVSARGTYLFWENAGTYESSRLETQNYLPLKFNFTDINNDGNLDFIVDGADESGNDYMYWFSKDAFLNFTSNEISTNNSRRSNMNYPIDIDLDGDIDIVTLEFVTNNTNGELNYYENDGSNNFTRHNILPNPTKKIWHCFECCDFDNDGDYDIIIGYGTDVCILENQVIN